MAYDNSFSAIGNAASRFVFVLLVILLVAAGAAGAYAWRQHKVNSLNQEISSLKSQLQTAKQDSQNNQATRTSPQPTPVTTYASEKGVKVTVYAPAKNAKVSSPLAIIGEVPGSWSFEASFPIILEDSNGGMIAQGTGQLLGDWMTNELVPFSAKLTFTGTPSGSGKLVLQRDNPSDLAQNADTVSIPVQL